MAVIHQGSGMKSYTNLFKFIIGLPFVILLALCWAVFCIFHNLLILPLVSYKEESREYYKDLKVTLKKLWRNAS